MAAEIDISAGAAMKRFGDALTQQGIRSRKRDGGKLSFCCPTHDDKDPSAVAMPGDGRINVHCSAGCIDTDMLKALGLCVSDLFDHPKRTNAGPNESPVRTETANHPPPRKVYPDEESLRAAVVQSARYPIAAEYPYRDLLGNEVLRVFRIEWEESGKQNKTFRQASPEGDGWKLSTEGVDLVPFHLPELLRAIAAGDAIYVVEGEKDVLAVEGAMGVATCNPMGANKGVERYAHHFEGAALVRVVADKDEPGRKHAMAWASALAPFVGRIEVVEPVEGKDAHDAIVTSDHTLESAFREVEAHQLTLPSSSPRSETESRYARARRVLSETIDQADCFRSPQGEAFAAIPVSDHTETWPIESRGFADWVERRFYEREGVAPSDKLFEAAIRTARQKARFDGDERLVALRCALHGDLDSGGARIYLDCCNNDWDQIEITSTGFRIIRDSPVHMRRAPGMLPLPTPAAKGDLTALRDLLNLSSEDDFVIAIAWQLSVMLPGFPQPILAISGAQGSGKTTASEMQGQLLDPNEQHVAGFPRNVDDLHIRANNARVLVIDNVSQVKPEISDELARAASGTSHRKRTHYKNREQTTILTRAPIILNGIPDFVGRPDLAERSLFLELVRIPKGSRRSEGDLWSLFREAHPSLLAALLEAAVVGLRNMPKGDRSNLERMADFHAWVRACEAALPWEPGQFDAAYSANRARAREKLMESSETFGALVSFLDSRDEWTGTSKDLLAALRNHVGMSHDDPDDTWVKSGKGMSNLLRRVGAELAEEGIVYTEPKRAPGGNRDRVMTLRRKEEMVEVCNPSSRPSPSSLSGSDVTQDLGTLGTVGTMDCQEKTEKSSRGMGCSASLDEGAF